MVGWWGVTRGRGRMSRKKVMGESQGREEEEDKKSVPPPQTALKHFEGLSDPSEAP